MWNIYQCAGEFGVRRESMMAYQFSAVVLKFDLLLWKNGLIGTTVHVRCLCLESFGHYVGDCEDILLVCVVHMTQEQ